MPRKFNSAAITYLADYAERALCLRRNSGSRVTAPQDAVAHSQALMVKIDALITSTRECGQWPAYRSVPSEPETAAQWRGSAHDAFLRAETMHDAVRRRMMREIAIIYETLASLVEIALMRQDRPPRV